MFRIGDKVQLKPEFWDASTIPTNGWGVDRAEYYIMQAFMKMEVE